MSIEEKLKAYILERYVSIREFTQAVDMSYSTVDSILRRGIGNSSVSNVIKICKALGISVDELSDGNIVPVKSYKKAEPRIFEVNDILADVKDQLLNSSGLTIDGKPADKQSINTIVQAMSIGEEMAKKV